MALGHEVRLMPAAYVKAYVKRGKTDAADAEAIAEAVTRPTMRFERVDVMRELVRGLHQGQQLTAASTGRTHDCTRPSAERQKHLASRRPSTHDVPADDHVTEALRTRPSTTSRQLQ
jgi:transposase